MVRPTFLSLVTLLGCVLSPGAPKAPFSLAVVPSGNDGKGGSITMSYNKPRDFYVVLTNVSEESQAIWQTSNSWGYQTISFEFTTTDGSKTVISKRQQEFTRNGPSTFLVQPGEHQVYAIRLDKEWEAHPVLSKTDEMKITVKAVYEVSPTPEASQYKIWTGRVESRSYNFILKQW